MTRFSASFLLLSVLALSKASLFVRAEEVAQVSTAACVINTPAGKIQVGRDVTLSWGGCKGSNKRIEVRYGLTNNLKKKDDYACQVSDMVKHTSCVWTPEEEGTFSFSVVDDSNIESFTHTFVVESRHSKAKRGVFAARALKEEQGTKVGKGAKGGKGKEGKGVKGGKEKSDGKGPEANEMKGHPKVEKNDKKPEYQARPVAVPRRRSLPRRI